MINKIIEYINQNRGTYTVWTISQQLRNEGYSADDIAEAWRLVEAADRIQHRTRYLRQQANTSLLICVFIVAGSCQGGFRLH